MNLYNKFKRDFGQYVMTFGSIRFFVFLIILFIKMLPGFNPFIENLVFLNYTVHVSTLLGMMIDSAFYWNFIFNDIELDIVSHIVYRRSIASFLSSGWFSRSKNN